MDLLKPFTDPNVVGSYAATAPRKVPGLVDFYRMTTLLIAERVPTEANILVLGAGGGLELKAMAEAQRGWRFAGVDPSNEMLDLARRTLGPLQQRVDLYHGYIDVAPSGPYDGATCLLTMHFLARTERLRTLREIHRRLKPGAVLVLMHHSCPEGETDRWLTMSVAFGNEASATPASASAAMLASTLPLLSAEEDEAVISDAGFRDISMFYAAFSFRGWVATA